MRTSKNNPWLYTALLRTPAGLIQKATIYANNYTQAYLIVKDLWPALRVVRITKEKTV